MKHIYLDKSFLFFLVIIIITGSFNNFVPYFSLLVIHECGHALTGLILGYQLDKISFYPYGGVTSFNLPLNIPLREELLILVMGPLMQIVGYFILKFFFDNIQVLHYTLLFFNLLPIYPLDGGKIFNVACGYFFNYLKSFYITFVISLIGIIILFLYNLCHFNLNLLLMITILLIKLLNIFQKRYYYYNRFLLERYLYQYFFPKLKNIPNIKEMYRDTEHFINYQNEKIVLKNYFGK